MRGAAAIAAFGLGAGCYAPTAPAGVPCTTVCPTGQECIAGFCRVPGTGPDAPGGPGGDPDGDGIASALDNCASVPNLDQHDEDADAIGDACDGCPHLASAGGEPDGDGDGVGDACDPRPGMAGDRIAVFDPFVGPDPDWWLSAGWSYANDKLRVDATSGAYSRLYATTGSSSIAIGGTIAWQGLRPRQLALTFGTEDRYHYCEWYDEDLPYTALSRNNNEVYDTLDYRPVPSLVDGRFTMQASERAVDAKASCTLVNPARTEQLAAPTPGGTVGNEIGIDVEHAVVELDYLIQIASP